MQAYELITCVRRANENAGNVISVVQFLINIYTYVYTYVSLYTYVYTYVCNVYTYVCIHMYIYFLKTELQISDFQHFHWLAGHKLSAHIPALPNMANERVSK